MAGDLGEYLYEQEMQSVEQYWFNQDASLTDVPSDPEAPCPTGAAFTAVKSTPPVCYNGNWPRAFVTYTRATDNSTQRHTLISRVFNGELSRTTFFDGSPLAAYTIEAIPAGPSLAYLSRNQDWLKATWQQLISDDASYQSQPKLKPTTQGVYQDVAATMQALLPALGSGLTGTGLAAALERINTVHPYFPAAMNTEAKYLAYTISALGSLNAGYTLTTPSGGASRLDPPPRSSPTTPPARRSVSPSMARQRPVHLRFPPVRNRPMWAAVWPRASGRHRSRPHPIASIFASDGTLNPAAGTSLVPASGSYTFPTDKSALASTFVTIPVRSDVATTKRSSRRPPTPTDIVTFAGRFSGSLIGAPAESCKKLYPAGPVVCDPTKGLQSVTRFALYQDECLTPGWQNCSFKEAKGNNYNMLVSYTSIPANAIRSPVRACRVTPTARSSMAGYPPVRA